MEKFLEEIINRYNANQKEIEAVNKQQAALYKKKRDLLKEFCDGLCKKYEQYIGKYVMVKFEDSAGNTSEAEGFLLGFRNYTGFNSGIYPDIAKRKKDGTVSKVLHPTYNIKPFMCIKSVELAED